MGAIVAEPDATDSDHASITLRLRNDDPIELICATSEDFNTWKDGLEFLSGDPNIPSGAVAPASEASELTEASTTDTTDQIEEELRIKLKLQQEATDSLSRDCETLRQASERKDATISRLLADLQGRTSGSAQYNKTASSSRESDEHLAERDIEMLSHKNKQLRAALQAKQDTIVELMDLLRRCLKRQELVSEAEVDESFDKARFNAFHAALCALQARVEASDPRLDVDDSTPSSKSSSAVDVHPDVAPMDTKEKAEAHLQQKIQQMKQQSHGNFAPPPRQSPKAAEMETEESTAELELVLQGIAKMSEQLNRLEKDVSTVTEKARPQNPSPVISKVSSPKAKGMSSNVKAASTLGSRSSSTATKRESALAALNGEMDVLLVKKNAVETLAKQFNVLFEL